MTRPQGPIDQAAILGAVIATFFTLDNSEGAWTWIDAFIGAAAGLVLLGFAYLPVWPWRDLRSWAQALALAAIGSFCFYLVSSPFLQMITGPCPERAKHCDDGAEVSERWMPGTVGVFFVLLVTSFVIVQRRTSAVGSRGPQRRLEERRTDANRRPAEPGWLSGPCTPCWCSGWP